MSSQKETSFLREKGPLSIVSQDTLSKWFIRGQLSDEQIRDEMQQTNPDLYGWLDKLAHQAPIAAQPLYGPLVFEYENQRKTIPRVRKATIDIFDAETRDRFDIDYLTDVYNQISLEQPILYQSLDDLIRSFGPSSENGQVRLLCMADTWTLLRRQAILDQASEASDRML